MSTHSGDGQSIIGFTEAEFGLVLATFFLMLFLLPEESTVKAKPEPPKPPTVSAESAQFLDSLLTEARLANKRLQNELRSKLAPSCKELRVASGPIFRVIAIGRNSFLLGEKRYSLEGLLDQFAPEMRIARERECRHQILVAFDPSRPVGQYDAGLRTLRSVFYVSQAGAAHRTGAPSADSVDSVP